MIYAVIDTNVFVSAFITNNKNAATALVFQHLLAGDITPMYNEEILSEYEEVLSRKKFHLPEEIIKDFIGTIKECGIHEERTHFDEVLPDEDDRVFLEISLSREDSFLVTGNLKHYPKLPEVVTPAEFIARFFQD
ncbi:MAG: putative toxin-antitoxin system toxin component, PIN family [Prevotellaceae bacterium]|nr:putative toxin-antitoxin system toxin component, PIN family [Prevotellaceae bacterium]